MFFQLTDPPPPSPQTINSITIAHFVGPSASQADGNGELGVIGGVDPHDSSRVLVKPIDGGEGYTIEH